MVRRFSQNISQETFAEHEIWDPFRSCVQSIHTNKKLYKLWWTQKPSQSGLTLLHHQHPLAKEQEHYICTRTKEKNEKHGKTQKNRVSPQLSIQPVSSMGACSGAASCNQQIHKRMLERHSMQHGASISKYMQIPIHIGRLIKYQQARLQHTGLAVQL